MTIIFTANNTENLNIMTNTFDKVFRNMWNTYGGKRVASWKEGKLLKVKMVYEANERFLKGVIKITNYRLCRNKTYNDEIEDMYFEEV